MLYRFLCISLFFLASTFTNATPYQLKSSLPVLQELLPKGSSQIIDITKDMNGLIWIADGSHLYSFDGKEITNQPFDLDVKTIYASPTNNYLLLGTSGSGLYRYDIETTELALINYGAHGEALHINSLTEDERKIYIGTINGLYIYDKKILQGKLVTAPNNVLGFEVRSLTWTTEKLAVAYAPVKIGNKKGGLFFLSNDLSWSKNLLPDGMTDIWDIYFNEHENLLWLASSNAGLFQISTIDNKVLKIFNKENGSLLSNAILSITGYDDVVFAGDFHNGLIKIKNNKVEYFKSNNFFPKSIDNLTIRELYHEPESQVLIAGLQAGGIVLIDAADQGIKYFRESNANFKANHIWALAELSDQTLVLGVYGHGLQLHQIDGKTRAINLDPSGKNARRNHIKKIIQLNETELLVGTLGAGVLKVNLKTEDIEVFFTDNQVVTDLLLDKEGIIVTSLGGVQKWNWQGESLFSYNNTNIVDSDKYFAVTSSKDSLFLGTNGGILIMSQNGVPIQKIEGCGMAVTQIIQLNKQKIAAATATGICIFSPTGQVLLVIDSRDILSMVWDAEKEELWGFGDDIIHHNLSEPTTDIFDSSLFQFVADKEAAALPLSNGVMVASSAGLALINPSSLKPYQSSSKLLLSNIHTPLKPVIKGTTKVLAPIELEANNNSINLKMQEINFRNNESDLYFRLTSGKSDSPWNLSQSQFINLNYLSPGEYKLQFMLSKPSTKQNITRETSIVVLAPWYLTLQAMVFYAVFLLLVIVGVYIWRLHSIKLKNTLLKKQVSIKTVELQNALQEKEALFENVSHELKTPLTLILGRSEQLLKRADLNTTTVSELKHIESSAEQLYQLVNQLLQLAEVKHQKAIKDPIDIIAQTQYVSDSLSSLAQSAGTTIKYRVHSSLDSHWLEMQTGAWPSIISNLITNAVKYGDNTHPIDVKLEITIEDVILTVGNKGATISSDKLEHVFSRFGQLDNNQQGQGLGLAIVKELSTNHYGDIKVSSTENETVFTVTIPNRPNQATQIEKNTLTLAEEKASKVSKGKQHILVVEDNQELREFIANTLATQFKVTAVEHGQVALDWLANNKLPNLILSDVMMPVMNGYELCEKLKQDPIYQYIPLFLLTAKADAQSIKKGLSLAADDYIAKPFNTDVLITKIGNQLATHAALKKYLQGKLLATPEAKSTKEAQSESEILLGKVSHALAEQYKNTDIKAGDIAKSLHLTEKTLNRKLEVIVGKSTSELLREYRLNQAKQLLEQGYKPKNVYFECGFNSMSYFSQSFKQEFGTTPSDFQKRQKIKAD